MTSVGITVSPPIIFCKMQRFYNNVNDLESQLEIDKSVLISLKSTCI